MNRNIQVFVLGIQNFGGEPETVSTRANGHYDFQNGLHKLLVIEELNLRQPFISRQLHMGILGEVSYS